MFLSISSFTDKRSDDILEDNLPKNNKTVTSPSTNGHITPGRRKSASSLLVENGTGTNGNSVDGGLKAPIAQDEDLDLSNCNEDDDHGTNFDS